MDTLRDIERRVIAARLRRLRTKEEVAKSLGLCTKALYNKIHKLGLSAEFVKGHAKPV